MRTFRIILWNLVMGGMNGAIAQREKEVTKAEKANMRKDCELWIGTMNAKSEMQKRRRSLGMSSQ